MRVEELMTKQVSCCGVGTSAAKAAELMWIHDCGILPVVDDRNGRLVGVVTDRDLFIALATKGQSPSGLTVGEVMQPEVFSCGPDNDLRSALETMAGQQVRRLPVVDGSGVLRGILSLNDVIRYARPRINGSGVSYEDVVRTLRAVSRHTHQRKTANAESGDRAELIGVA